MAANERVSLNTIGAAQMVYKGDLCSLTSNMVTKIMLHAFFNALAKRLTHYKAAAAIDPQGIRFMLHQRSL